VTLPPTIFSMANTKSASKRARQTQRGALRNRQVLSQLRTLSRRVGNSNPHAGDITALISAIDKAAKRGIIHRNAAIRRKARLMRVRATAAK